jgi:ATP-dependent Lon protease
MEAEEVLWIDDDTLTDDSEDSDYHEGDEVPVPLTIRISTIPEEEEHDERSVKNDGFIMYLLDKYVRNGEPMEGIDEEDEEDFVRRKKEKDGDFPLRLNRAEKTYFKNLKPVKQKHFMEMMTRVSKFSLEEGNAPYKFRVLDMPLSDYVKSQILKKIDLLDDMSHDNGESYKLKNWIEGFMRVPFGKTTPLPIRLTDGRDKCTKFMIESRKEMNKAIYGMNDAKLQIMQIISQWIVNPNSVGNVIALRGPMGTGKTSFAKSAIANVLNRPFEFFSLGGASDISNFVGHSYTYEGSMWGRIVDCLMHAGTMNPVLYFDEVDKISNTPHGEEITSMLIHLTDRSQNTQFHDRYFSGIDFDLSQCLFVFSLNDLDKVHPILRDRMTIITCDGYNEKDKREILKNYVWPQLLERLFFDTTEVILTDSAMKFLISEFSGDEKGVRTLIRTVETMMTRLNMLRIANDDSMKEYNFYMEVSCTLTIDEEVVKTLLNGLNKKEVENWRHMYV